MKTLAAAIIIVAAGLAETGYSQNINWRSMDSGQRNIIQLGFGYDYGVTGHVGYGRSFTVIRPVLVQLDYSFPMGNDLLDDFTVRLGGQIEVVQAGAFSATLKIMSNFRRYQNALVRIVGFGSDFAAVAGYYKPTWFAAGEFGFDKSIVANLKHSDVMKAYYPAIRDGWYIPMGGHYYYGIQGGKTIGDNFDLSLRLGATRAQDDDENAVIPYYLQLGLSLRF